MNQTHQTEKPNVMISEGTNDFVSESGENRIEAMTPKEQSRDKQAFNFKQFLNKD